MRVLVVEDSDRLRSNLCQALRNSSYAVDGTGDGNEGLWMAESGEYDVIVLDIMLPGMDGLTILRRLREQGSDAGVLMLTAKGSVPERVQGLRSGADDYLGKPFELEELLARVWSLCRRRYGRKQSQISIGDLSINLDGRTVSHGDEPITLSAREYRLLEYLVIRRGEVVSREEIESHIYDEQADLMSNVVESTICDLRKKITAPDGPPVIHTRRGLGYIIEAVE